MAKELTKKSVPVNMANGPANAKVYTFTRGENLLAGRQVL
jgi:hypothetical protein